MSNNIYMQLINTIECFEKISQTTKLNEKKSLLKQYNCKLLQLCLYYCYNPFLQFNIKQIPIDENIIKRSKLDIKAFFKYLKTLSQQESATRQDRIRISLLMGSDPKIRKWLERIILKDLGIGININTINSVFPDLIPKFKVMKAEPQSKLEKFLKMFPEFYVNYKLDGIRCLAVCKSNSIILYTQNGKRLNNFTKLESILIKETKELTSKYGTVILDGELTDGNWRNFQDLMTTIRRKHGSGRIDYDDVVFNIFDIFNVDNTLTKQPLEKRIEVINKQFDHYPLLSEQNPESIVRLDYQFETDNNLNYIINLLNKSLDLGFEGLILKNPNTEYKFKRSIDWTKVKKFDTIDCTVIDIYEGKNKYKNMLGGVIVQLPNGLTNEVGSGFSDFERQYYWDNPNEIVGNVIEIQYQEWTDKGKLRFPTFVRIRDDK